MPNWDTDPAAWLILFHNCSCIVSANISWPWEYNCFHWTSNWALDLNKDDNMFVPGTSSIASVACCPVTMKKCKDYNARSRLQKQLIRVRWVECSLRQSLFGKSVSINILCLNSDAQNNNGITIQTGYQSLPALNFSVSSNKTWSQMYKPGALKYKS